MAWDSDDRRSRLLLALLVVLHLLAISRQVDTGGGVSLLEKAVLSGLHPFQLVVSRSAAGVAEGWHGFVDLRGVREDNRRLRVELDALRAELRRHELRAEESQRLRALLELREMLPAGGVAAEVVARGALPWYRTFVVDRGSSAGVALNAPVVCSEGLVGRTIVVAPGASKVQSLLDQHAGAAVMVERSRVTGLVSGQVGATGQLPWLAMKYVPASSDVVAGDRVLTSGLDRIYPKGLLVGHVAQVNPGSGLFQEILVAPAAPFERLEAVLLLPPATPEPLLQEEPR